MAAVFTSPMSALADAYRSRVVDATTSLFSHADYPLADTMSYRGDPGLFGPDSMTWPVIGDVTAFVGGLRALLVQAAHPEVAAGVADHSRYRTDPLGRLSRTSSWVTATSFGAMAEVEAAVAVVRGAHRPVRGRSHRDRPYSASHPEMAAWVHNALTDSFLAAYRHYGPRRLTEGDADRFVAEQTKVGALLDAAPLPTTAADLSSWIVDHPDLARSPGQAEAIRFLRNPPLPLAVRAGYAGLFAAAVATLPTELRRLLGLVDVPGAEFAGRAMVSFLRWSLGSSPTWHLALTRVGAEIPDGLFHRSLLDSESLVAD
ncbi:MAG: oxygenase MpaB family protein [Acidimicrobiales bacterium]